MPHVTNLNSSNALSGDPSHQKPPSSSSCAYSSKNISAYITPPPSNSPVVSANHTPPSSLSLPPIVNETSYPPSVSSSSSAVCPEYSSHFVENSKSNLNVSLPHTSPITPTSPNPPSNFSCRMTQQQMISPNVAVPSNSGYPYVPILPSTSVPHNQVSMPKISPAGISLTSANSMTVTQERLFEIQLTTDQKGALYPDVDSDFKSNIDACKRFIRYHVLSDKGPSPQDLDEQDAAFECASETYLKKINAMKYKYQSLLLKDSVRRHATVESVMLYRLFNQDEKNRLERDKNMVTAGRGDEVEWICPRKSSNPSLSANESLYPWEDDWEQQKLYKFSPHDFGNEQEEETKPDDEMALMQSLFRCSDPDMFKSMKSRASNGSSLVPSSLDDTNAPPSLDNNRDDLHTPCSSIYTRYDIDSPTIEKQKPEVKKPSAQDSDFADHSKKTQKIQEQLYDKLLADSLPS